MANELGEYSHATIMPEPGGVTVRGGVIRFLSSGPFLYTNKTHQSVGIIPESVKINDSGDLEFRLDVGLPVVSLWADPDETLTDRKIMAGISGGGSLCIVRFSRADDPIGVKIDLNTMGGYGRLRGTTSNVWVGVVSYNPGE